jgi:tetratricopeptide (TPR) repeat protein
MAARLIESDPAAALEHALAARERAGRIGAVREAAGVAAYQTGDFTIALRELRAARRLTGMAQHLPLIADCERGLGRPRRALELAGDPAVQTLDEAGRIEMLIVASGARRDLGEHETSVAMLQIPELRGKGGQPWVARLRYAYAEALEAAERHDEARHWFEWAAEADEDGLTDASERIAGPENPAD